MTAARWTGAIVAAIVAILLGWLAVANWTWDPRVLPTVTVTERPSANAITDTTGTLRASRELAERTRLMDDRRQAGSVGGVSVAPRERPLANITTGDRVANPERRLDDWQRPAVSEDILREPAMIRGSSSLPYRNADILEQPQGRDWRGRHNGPVRFGGGWLLLGVLFVLGAFLFARGRIRTAEELSGSRIERFSAFERANHWMTASGFIVLGLTGLVIIYGKPLLMPLTGEAIFGNIAGWSAWLHMASMVPFVAGIVVMAVMWARQNLPTWLDWEWLKAGGGFLYEDGNHPPARRFNAGQKIVFWGVTLGGALAFLSGLTLMFPFYWFGYTGMEWAQLFHSAVGLAMIALIFGHIYIGTIGMEGAIEAMWDGDVDETWAKEHHALWWREIKEQQGEPVDRPTPAE